MFITLSVLKFFLGLVVGKLTLFQRLSAVAAGITQSPTPSDPEHGVGLAERKSIVG